MDETILFEPEISSVYTESLIVSGLGMQGKYINAGILCHGFLESLKCRF